MRILSAIILSSSIGLISLTLNSAGAAARDRDMRIMGGSGGAEYYMRCKPGSYLVGIHGRAGDWFDAVGPICRHFPKRITRFSRMAVSSAVFIASKGGGNGSKFNAPCLGTDRAIKSIMFNLTKPGGGRGRYVDNFEATCAKVDVRLDNPTIITVPTNDDLTGGLRRAAGAHFYRRQYGTEKRYTLNSQSCPHTELAVGIRVRAGLYVDGIGLICSPAPLLASNARSTGAAKRKGTVLRMGRALRKPISRWRRSSTLRGALPKYRRIGRAIPQIPPQVRKHFSITCTSRGQMCNRPARLYLPSGARKAWQIDLRVSSRLCSRIQFIVAGTDGAVFGRTGLLTAGQQSTIRVPALRVVHIWAQGIIGGCNRGRLVGWSVKASGRPM